MDYSNILQALMLLVVGMSTVSIVLTIIILGGKLLIKAVNNFLPEEEKSAPAAQPSLSPAVSKVISAAVDKVTCGQAEVLDVKPL